MTQIRVKRPRLQQPERKQGNGEMAVYQATGRAAAVFPPIHQLDTADVLSLQHTAGNRRVQRLLDGTIQRDELDMASLRQQMERGQALYLVGNWQGALDEFQALYGIQHPEMAQYRPSMLWNMATCYQRLGQFDQAITAYEEYLHYPGVSQADRQQVLNRIRECRMGNREGVGSDTGGETAEPVNPANVRAQFDDAITRYNASDWQGALDRFLPIYGNPHPDMAQYRMAMIWNIATCYQRLRQFDDAIRAYQEYLHYPGISDRAVVLERIRQCRMGETTAPTDQDGAASGASDIATLQAQMSEGMTRYAAGDWQGTLEQFLPIYGNPHPDMAQYRRAMIWNIATCYQRLARFDEAMSAYQEYLHYSGVSDRQEALERIRQVRMGEVGRNVTITEGDPLSVSGNEEMLFMGQVYFDTGSHTVSSAGQETLRTLVALLRNRHTTAPNQIFRIAIVGAASSRWRNARTPEESDQFNLELSQRRADSAEALLTGQLPAADITAGVYQLVPEGMGDDLSEAAGLDPDNNSWAMRSVTVTVWASDQASQTETE